MNAKAETIWQDSLSNGRQPVAPRRSSTVSLSKAYIPKWLSQTTKALYAILALDDNWDSYGAKRISPEIASAADELLRDIMLASTPAPQVVPSANGSIQLEWHIGGIDLEIEVESLAISQVIFEDKQNEEPAWEGEINYDLTRLVHYIQLLTARVSYREAVKLH
jgi:hypothetical protein